MGFWEQKKVLVTGGAGFLGSYVVNALKEKNVSDVLVPRSATSDLTIRENTKKAVQNMDLLIHCAAKVGGIGLNQEKPGELVFDNLMMGMQLMEEARLAGIEKFVVIGTISSYPKVAPMPLNEDDLWDGYPEEVTAPYGLAKKMLLVQGQAYRKQYGFMSITLLPVNLYGPGDNFDPSSSHAIAAIIRKVIDAKRNDDKSIVVWGSGQATRDFLYAADAAEGIVLAAERYENDSPVNLGSGREVSIKELTELIVELSEYHGEIVWDTAMPEGQPRRCVDTRRAIQGFGFEAQTDLREGLKKTIDWYIKHY